MGKKITLALLLLLFTAVWLGWILYGDAAATLEQIRLHHAQLVAETSRNFPKMALVFFLLYFLLTSLSFPAATLFTLASGAVLGLGWGLVVSSFAGTLGASASFLLARYLLRNAVERRFPEAARRVNAGFEREGVAYLLTLRLLPVMPYFLCNLLMGLTRIPLWKYALASQLGMLPAMFVYVYAGTHLFAIRSLGDVLTLEVLVALGLLGMMPLFASRLVARLKNRGA